MDFGGAPGDDCFLFCYWVSADCVSKSLGGRPVVEKVTSINQSGRIASHKLAAPSFERGR